MSQSVEAILASCNLSKYAGTLEKQGYVDVPTLASMNIGKLQTELNMKRGHARQLRIALLAAAAIAAKRDCEEPSARSDSPDIAAGRDERMRDSSIASGYAWRTEKEEEHARAVRMVRNSSPARAGATCSQRERAGIILGQGAVASDRASIASEYDGTKDKRQEPARAGCLARVDVASESCSVVPAGMLVRYSSPARAGATSKERERARGRQGQGCVASDSRAAGVRRPRNNKMGYSDAEYSYYSSSSSTPPERMSWRRSDNDSDVRPDGRGRIADRATGPRRDHSRVAEGRRGFTRGLCRLFVRYRCKWGDGCKYAHDSTRAQLEAKRLFSQGVGFGNATARTKTGTARAASGEDALARRCSDSQRSRSR
jgi:hypothetical protein